MLLLDLTADELIVQLANARNQIFYFELAQKQLIERAEVAEAAAAIYARRFGPLRAD